MPQKRNDSSSSSQPGGSKKLKRSDGSEILQDQEPVLIDEVVESSPKSTPNVEENVEKSETSIVDEEESRFIDEPVPEDDARQRWPHRYTDKRKGNGIDLGKSVKGNDDELTIQAKRHYTKAEVDGCVKYNLGDDAYVQADEGQESYICRIVEMFEALDGLLYFTAQWFYRAKDTIIKNNDNLIDEKRVFLSEVKNDNPLDCLVKKLNILRLPLSMDMASRKSEISECDYYYDMMYLLPNFSFVNLPQATDDMGAGSESSSTISSDANVVGVGGGAKFGCTEVSQVDQHPNSEMTLLDLYSGCGAMSTGLCLGANMAGANLLTKWAVDLNSHACDSLKLNHPETEVRNESAEDYLNLLKEWLKLCITYSLVADSASQECVNTLSMVDDDTDESEEADVSVEDFGSEEYEVERVLAICYGDPKKKQKSGLYFKIRWKGFGPNADSWEPMEGLGDCKDKIKEFVTIGYKSKILPLPGNVDVICGGPPCQGISGFNRFRNKEKPLEDPKNKQLVVFMDFVEFLRPRFVLMENVVDIVRFADKFLGRYALARLVGMNYQTRVGIMAAGSFGLPQFRMRVFFWGACPTEKLPQYPLPTHNLVVRGGIPNEFESCVVAYEEGSKVDLEKELLLRDAIYDLPPVENDETRDEMPYGDEPQTEFQHFIRLPKDVVGGLIPREDLPMHALYDHRPLCLNEDDYQRVCKIPMEKGANFRDLEGVRIGLNNKVEWDPDVKRVFLPSGKPLVPNYAMTFVNGSSSKPFGRLWWDETVPTVVTRAEPHNQTILHPKQNRVLTIRENARLQGFPDYYRLLGPIKERYIQVGNAVAVPVARALGYALALASQGSCGEEPLFTLPKKFPNIVEDSSQLEEDD